MKRCCMYRCTEKKVAFADMIQFCRQNMATIIDVRSKQEFDEWHVDGALNIPVWDIKNKVPTVVNNLNKYIVVYCASGIRSRKAQKILLNMGYTNTYNVYDGIYG